MSQPGRELARRATLYSSDGGSVETDRDEQGVPVIGQRAAWLLAGVLTMLSLAGCGRAVLADDGSSGQLIVIDGDTLDLGGELIELAGVDAPELGQRCLDGETLYTCGLTAAFELQKIVRLEPVVCTRRPESDPAFECLTPDGPLGTRLVEQGLAVATAGSDLERAADRARRVPLGIWRGQFVPPSAWREGRRTPAEQNMTQACPVLGLEQDGRRIYKVPTDPGYDAATSEAGGDAVRFCSDEAARAAGYAHG